MHLYIIARYLAKHVLKKKKKKEKNSLEKGSFLLFSPALPDEEVARGSLSVSAGAGLVHCCWK